MKRFCCVLILIALVTTCSTAAFALDVKFSGSFYAAGLYLDKTNFRKDSGSDGINTALYYQRLRVQTEFVVAPGLFLVTRFDALERAWGAARSTPGITPDSQSAGTRAENENIALDWAYVHYVSPIGTFRAGYMNDGAWGTVFMDTAAPRGKVAWSNTTGQWFYTLQLVKMTEKSSSAQIPATAADADSDKYVAAVRYTWPGGEAGLLGGMGRDAHNRPTANSYTLFYTLQPYTIARIGPVRIQAELDYFWGDWSKSDSGAGSDVAMQNIAAFLDATADFGMFYLGGTFAYVSGDDPATTDKLEGNNLLVNGGMDWNSCLILFNSDLSYWAGSQLGYNASIVPVNPSGYNGGPMTNAWFVQGRAGVRPMEKLDIMASVAYAAADKKPTGYVSGVYGYEIDLTGTYKITNNLSYLLGVGYLVTGDYFKGTGDTNKITNNYLVIHKLTFTF